MSQVQIHPVIPEFARTALVTRADYETLYRQSVSNPDSFWREQGKILD